MLTNTIKAELFVNGMFMGLIIALGAVGLSLIYGILKFANIAHGDLMTISAYITFFILAVPFNAIGITGAGLGPFTFGYPMLLAIPLSILIITLLVLLTDFLIYSKLRFNQTHSVIVAMGSLGVAIAIRGLIYIFWGGSTYQFPRLSKQFYLLPLDIKIPPDNIFVGIVAIMLIITLYWFLNRTKMGKAMRATSDNPDLAKVTGIPTRKVIMWTWIIGGSLAATAGILLAISQAQLYPIMGWKLLLPLFAAVIIGGIGNPYGALLGALLMGVTTEVSTQWISTAYKPVVAFVLLIITLLIKPQGITGEKQ